MKSVVCKDYDTNNKMFNEYIIYIIIFIMLMCFSFNSSSPTPESFSSFFSKDVFSLSEFQF